MRTGLGSTTLGEFVVISLKDCIALCGLTEQEVSAIAEHEHVPEIAAAAMGRYLLKEPHGAEKIGDMDTRGYPCGAESRRPGPRQ
jgi:hypothetical protein